MPPHPHHHHTPHQSNTEDKTHHSKYHNMVHQCRNDQGRSDGDTDHGKEGEGNEAWDFQADAVTNGKRMIRIHY